jgi:hypothetical protein
VAQGAKSADAVSRGAVPQGTGPQGTGPAGTESRLRGAQAVGGPEDVEPRAAEPQGVEGRAAKAHGGETQRAPDTSAADGRAHRDDGEEPVVRDPISAPGPDGQPQRTTRRFPRVTRDTARPEGGGRAASGDAPAPARQWPMLTVVAAVGLGLLLTALGVFRYGTLLIGTGLLAGGVMRWTLPSVGMLAVRSRFTDLVTYGILGVTIVLLAMMAQPKPWLEIPFLDDTLHFTIRT